MTRQEIFSYLTNICMSWGYEIVPDDDKYCLEFYFTEDGQEWHLRSSMQGYQHLRNFIEGVSGGEWTLETNCKDPYWFNLIGRE